MNNPFTNNKGTKNFAQNFFDANNAIPQSRYIDKEYQALIKRSLTKGETNDESNSINTDTIIMCANEPLPKDSYHYHNKDLPN